MRYIFLHLCVLEYSIEPCNLISFRLSQIKKLELMWTNGTTLNETATTWELTAILTCGRYNVLLVFCMPICL